MGRIGSGGPTLTHSLQPHVRRGPEGSGVRACGQGQPAIMTWVGLPCRYYDGLARKRLGLRESFDRHIIAPLQRDLLKYTWLHERYNCQGDQAVQRTSGYFEFPSVSPPLLPRCMFRQRHDDDAGDGDDGAGLFQVVAMLLREVRYGLEITLQKVTVAPFLPANTSREQRPTAPHRANPAPTPSFLSSCSNNMHLTTRPMTWLECSG